eukprot:scaffold139419_cov76-Cyclotella_meneghiniana.AAC.2
MDSPIDLELPAKCTDSPIDIIVNSPDVPSILSLEAFVPNSFCNFGSTTILLRQALAGSAGENSTTSSTNEVIRDEASQYSTSIKVSFLHLTRKRLHFARETCTQLSSIFCRKYHIRMHVQAKAIALAV